MKTNITLNVALDAGGLRETASLLVAMAIGLENMHKVEPDTGGESSDNTTTDLDVEIANAASTAGPDVFKPLETSGDVETQTADVVTLSGVELDADGLPWDERIHVASKAKLKKTNTWRHKKQLDPALVASVEAELRAAMAAPSPAGSDRIDYEVEAAEIEQGTTAPPPPQPEPGTTAPPPPAPEVATVTKYITDDGGEFTHDELIAAGWTEGQIAERETVEVEIEPGTVTEVLEQETTAEPEQMTFPVLMGHITPAIANGDLTNDQVNAAVTKQGLPSLQLLAARPDLIPAVYADLFAAG